MAEKDIILENNGGAGEIKIANDVIASIAAQALNEVDGIALSSSTDNFVEKLVKKASSTTPMKIYLDEEGKNVDMDVHVSVKYGVNIPEISWKIQEVIKKNVEAMTDIDVKHVHVFVDGVIIEKDPKPEKPKKQKVKKSTEEDSAEKKED